MTLAVESIRPELASLVGESRVVSDPTACAALAVDGKVPKYIVYPPSGEQVAAVLHYAAERDLAVIPCRNATKLNTGNAPQRYDVAVSLKEMNQVWHYEPDDLTISVEPGMKFGDFEHFVGRHRLWLPLDPRGGSKASLGGILATNSAGPLRLHYGAPRDIVLGMKIATTEGKIIKTGGRVVKNVAGYDLGKLLVGSYGTLGVIVEASLKLFPLPSERVTFSMRTGTLGIARDLHSNILHSPLDPLRMLLLDPRAATLVRAGTPQTTEMREHELWLEAGGSKRVIERCERDLEGMSRGAGVPITRLDAGDADLLWARISDLQPWLAELHPQVVILKATLPISGAEEFLSHAQQEAESEKVGLAGFAQVGVGIVHLCILEPRGVAGFAGLVRRLRKAAEDLGGALVVESCPFDLKSRVDVWGVTGDDLDAMRKLKAVWDPKSILAPGRFVGGL